MQYIDDKRESHPLRRMCLAMPLGKGKNVVRVWLPMQGRFEIRIAPPKGGRPLVYTIDASEFVHPTFRTCSDANQASVGFPTVKNAAIARGIFLVEPFTWRLPPADVQFTVLLDTEVDGQVKRSSQRIARDNQHAVDASWHRMLVKHESAISASDPAGGALGLQRAFTHDLAECLG